MYTIKKGLLYVAVGGRQSSYTNNPEYAVKYSTKEEAEKNACGNETVVKMELTYR